MNALEINSGVAPHAWLQHHLPWLALFALVVKLFREDNGIGFDPDGLNG